MYVYIHTQPHKKLLSLCMIPYIPSHTRTYVHTHVCMYVCMYVCVRVCMVSYITIEACCVVVYVYIHACMHTNTVRSSMDVMYAITLNIYMYVCMCMRIYVYACIS